MYMHENGAERAPQGNSTHEGFINCDDDDEKWK